MRYDASACDYNFQVLSDEFPNVRRRVAAALLGLTDNVRSKPRVSQKDLATTLGTSWDTINKSLASLTTDGAISFERHKITVNKPKLESIAAGQD